MCKIERKLDCDFESSACDWKNSDEDSRWQRTQAKNGRIQKDHTTGTGDGHYMFTKYYKEQVTQSLAKNFMHEKDDRCFEFYYYLDTSFKHTLTFNVSGETKWRKNTDSLEGKFWQYGKFTYKMENPKVAALVFFENSRESEDKFALDDIYITNGICLDPFAIINSTCSFQTNQCGYTFQNWNIKRASGQIDLNLNDHTTDTQSGGFAYYKPKSYQKPGDVGRMNSTRYSPRSTTSHSKSARCMEFYFYMDTKDTISLSLDIVFTSDRNEKKLLWQRSIDHTGSWWKANVNTKLVSEHFFVFTAEILKDGSLSRVIAVDDINYRDGECSALSDLCDFEEHDLCTWNNAEEMDLDWRVVKAETQGTSVTDHTTHTGEGHYVNLDVTLQTIGMRAELLSEPYLDSEPGCLHFWYHKEGEDIGTLNIILTTNVQSTRKVIWTLSGDHGFGWNSATVPFETDSSHQIIIEGVRGNGASGGIFLDDIIITRGELMCWTIPSIAKPSDDKITETMSTKRNTTTTMLTTYSLDDEITKPPQTNNTKRNTVTTMLTTHSLNDENLAKVPIHHRGWFQILVVVFFALLVMGMIIGIVYAYKFDKIDDIKSFLNRRKSRFMSNNSNTNINFSKENKETPTMNQMFEDDA